MPTFTSRRVLLETRFLALIISIVVWEKCVVSIAAVDRELQVKPSGETFAKPTGSSFMFTCEVTGADDDDDGEAGTEERSYNLQWHHNDKEIAEKSARVYVEDESSSIRKLFLTEIRDEDEGSYICSGMIDGAKQEKTVKLFLYKDITFDHAPEVQHPAVYTDAVVECRVSGVPVPEVSWRFQGERLQMDAENGRYKRLSEGLLIRNISRDDDGQYLCRAEVEAEGRYDERKVSVIVHIPPKILEGPGISEGTDGNNISISCKASGLPNPEFRFYKVGSTVPVETSVRVSVDAAAGTIAFHPLKKEDEGNYTCVAHNDVGNDTVDGEVKVQVKPSIDNLKNVSETEGETTSLICSSLGDPVPQMTFQRVGNPEVYKLGDNADGRITVSLSESGRQLTLTFASLVPEDSADYVCRAESKIGSDENSATLTVNYRPRFADDHPKLLYIWAGKTRNMTCNVKAEPVPKIEWLRGETAIANNDTYFIYGSDRRSILQVKVTESDQSWIYGDYSCQASNLFGKQEWTITLERASAPDSPKVVNVTEILPTEFVIQVEPPETDGGERVIGYRVEYVEVVQNTTSVSVEGGDESVDPAPEYNRIPSFQDFTDTGRIELVKLNPNTTYALSVKAKNEVGYGKPTTRMATTLPVQKPYPIVITSERMGTESHSYTVTWEKPKTGGLPIKEYKFKYRKVAESGASEGEKKDEMWTHKYLSDDAETRLEFKIDQLIPSSTYELQVSAQNKMGWSDVNGVFQFETREGVASAQVSSVGTGAIAAIVVVIFVVLLVVVDVACYFVNSCGVTMCICVHLCGKSQGFTKEKAMEQGESSKEVLKQPIETYQPEGVEGNQDVAEAQLPPPAYNESKEQCLKTDDEKEAVKEELKEGLEQVAKTEKEDEDKEKEKAADKVKITGESKDKGKTEKAPVV